MSSHLASTESSKDHGSKPISVQKRKIMTVTVNFLDDSSHVFQLQAKTLGQVLFDKVCKFLNLIEVDYFGLEYEDGKGTKCWLDALKPLCNQVSSLFPTMDFCVKFYTPDPVQLEDEFTRYLFSLQLKKDLSSGFLQCNDNTAAVIISYIVQAEIGDFDPDKFVNTSYLSNYKFVPHQELELEHKIMDNHRKLIGQNPAEADVNLLETARRCELYGIKMTPAKDGEGGVINLAVAHVGILVFQNFTKIITFSWTKIRKLSFKRKKFLIKLHQPEGYYKDTVEFFFDGRNECKNFWKKCIENHTFFRCSDAKQGMRQKAKIFSRGSSFRYSGRTQKQVSEYVRENLIKRPPFKRSTSLRTPTSPSRSTGSPIPQPLLPVTSASCGSISDIPKSTPSKILSASEPTTPYVAPDINRSINGNCSTVQDPDDTDSSFKSETFENVENNNNMVKNYQPNNLSNSKPETSPTEIKENGYPSIKVQAHIEHVPISKTQVPSIDGLHRLSGESKGVEPTKLDQKFVSEDVLYQLPVDENFINDLQQSFGSSTFYVSSPLAARLGNSKKTPSHKSYALAKEILMTERTYRKDLEIINVVFRDSIYKQFPESSDAVDNILSIIDPLYEMHCSLLRDLEQRLAFWEGRRVHISPNAVKGVGDIFLNHREMIKLHSCYLKQLPSMLQQLQKELNCDDKLAHFYQQFMAQKLCYLPFTSFLLRLAFRLTYYSYLLKALVSCYESDNEDYGLCKDALDLLKGHCESFENKIVPVINYVKLMELQKSLFGFPELLNENRNFIREGCLLKFSRNSSHQHMFFLFSDVLLYTSRIHNSQLHFKVQGELSTSTLKIEETEPRHGVSNCFSLCSGEKHIVVAASSEREHLKWMRDFKKASQSAKRQISSPSLSSQSSRSLSEERYESSDEMEDSSLIRDEKSFTHHVNTSIHICWHRNISISSHDLLISLKHSISGYLLRKFKNNSGWQKLWVVLANLCLFFYKSYLDESPLASLPLAGYKILNTSSTDIVNGDCIFKLQFKSHEYFFMAESKHTYERWMEAVSYCTLTEEENTHL